MKNTKHPSARKFTLQRETLRQLSAARLVEVAGGSNSNGACTTTVCSGTAVCGGGGGHVIE